MKHWFTADYHLGHANIMKYCGRTLFMTPTDLSMYKSLIDKSEQEQKKFKISMTSLTHMNSEIIRRHNERVKAEDIVFHIGDFCFKNSSSKRGEGVKRLSTYWEKQLNGKIIHLKGNHDKNNSTKTIIERLVIGYGGKRINLVHIPDFIDINYEINFVGHVHNKWKIKRVQKGYSFTDCINVGVDVWNFYPISFEEIYSRYSKWLKSTLN